jgi:hypothetical protein
MILSSYKKYIPLSVLLGLLVAIGGIVWYGMLPLQRSLTEKMRGIQEFYAGRENRERQVSKLPELEGQYAAILANEKTLDILMSEDEIVDFVKILEKLAGEMNVTMSIASKDGGKIIEPKKLAVRANRSDGADQESSAEKNTVPQKAVGILDAVPFDRYLSLSVKVEGRYDAIVAFLGKLETLPFGLDVIRMEMKKKDAESDARSRPARPTGNPFAILGDSSDIVPITPPSAGTDALEAVFDMLVYVKKTGL